MAAGSIPNSKFVTFHVVLSQEGLAKRSHVLGPIPPGSWSTTQAHTLPSLTWVSISSFAGITHLPLCAHRHLKEAYKCLQISFDFKNMSQLGLSTITSATIDPEIKCSLDKKSKSFFHAQLQGNQNTILLSDHPQMRFKHQNVFNVNWRGQCNAVRNLFVFKSITLLMFSNLHDMNSMPRC